MLKLDSNAISSISPEILKLKNLKGLSLGNNKSLGEQSVLEAIVYLKNINDAAVADALLKAADGNLLKPVSELRGDKLPIWKSTTHSFGFVNHTGTGATISDATKITADAGLKNSAIKLTLDLLYVEDYPGSGRHRVLIAFSGKNQINDDTREQVNYAVTKTVQEGQFAGTKSVPMVVGLRVGKEGVEFKCSTTNVKNENDEKMMEIMDSEVASDGLKLLSTVNPVIPIVSNLVSGIGKMFLTRNENKLIQDFNFGLDFGTNATKAKLAEGSYIVAQTGEDTFKWSDWKISDTNGNIVSKTNPDLRLPYNYLVFSISKVQL